MRQEGDSVDERGIPMLVDILVFEGCPHAGAAIALVRDVAARLAPDAYVNDVDI